MKRVHIVGGKNHGKTTLLTELVQELTRQGLRVGTIKHTHHQHELDAPGKDSHRHREAGAAVVGILSRAMNAVFWPPTEAGEDRYEGFASMFDDCDLVLVEGDLQTDQPKVEVWRESQGSRPYAERYPSIEAVVSHDMPEGLDVPILDRADIAGVAEKMKAIADVG